MIGVDMSLQRVAQLQLQFSDQGRVAASQPEDRINQHRLATGLVPQQISVGAGLRVEELSGTSAQFVDGRTPRRPR